MQVTDKMAKVDDGPNYITIKPLIAVADTKGARGIATDPNT